MTDSVRVKKHLLLKRLQEASNGASTPSQVWTRISREVLRPDDDFSLHLWVLSHVFRHWPQSTHGPPPLWSPLPEEARATNLAVFMRTIKWPSGWEGKVTGDPQMDFPLLYRLSVEKPELYFGAVLRVLEVFFYTPPVRILDEQPQPDRCTWLPGARMNVAASALLSRMAPSDGHPAIIWAGEGAPEELRVVSRAQLRVSASRIADCLRTICRPGDAVAIVLPMSADAVAVYLGIVIAGCVVVSIAESFASTEIATRLRISKAKAVFTQDVLLRAGKVLPLHAKVCEAWEGPIIVVPASSTPQQPPQCVLRGSDMSWETFKALAPPRLDIRPNVTDANQPTNILFSSGTTGEPKALVWSHVTPLKCAADGWAHQDLRPGQVAAWPTSMGWMMGPWLVYATLFTGATMALYQGSPLGRDFGVFVERAGVQMLGVVPSIVKGWRHSGCMKGLDWSRIRSFSSTGEASAPEDYHWLMARGGYKPVVEYCGGTELGGAFISGTLLQPQAPSTFTTPTMGTAMALLLPGGGISMHPDPTPTTGEVALGGILLGASQRILNRDHAEVYFRGMPQDPRGPPGRSLRRHGDELQRWESGRYSALGRCDDTMNLGGIKVGSVEIERVVVEGVSEVAEAAAVGLPTPGGGPEQLHLFLVLAPSSGGAAVDKEKLQSSCQAVIRNKLNPLFKVDAVQVVPSLPRNASNKVMRRLLRDKAQAHTPHAKL